MKKAQSKSKARRAEPEGSNKAPAQAALDQSRALFLVVAATILAYANSLGGAFVFDDTKQIAGNPALRSWSNILRAFTSDVWSFQRGTLTKDIPPPYYRPLFTVYLTVNYKLFGLWEPGWHFMNLLVHCGATVAVFFLIKRLSGDRLIATLAALLFGLHPAHVESVSWISGIPDPLAALFYVPSLIWYIRYRTEGDKKFLIASLAAYGLSALCKETPLALPLVFIAWEFARTKARTSLSSRGREIVPQMIPFAVVGGAYLALRFAVLGRISWKHPFMAQVPDSGIWMTVPYVLVSYLWHLFCHQRRGSEIPFARGANPRPRSFAVGLSQKASGSGVDSPGADCRAPLAGAEPEGLSLRVHHPGSLPVLAVHGLLLSGGDVTGGVFKKPKAACDCAGGFDYCRVRDRDVCAE